MIEEVAEGDEGVADAAAAEEEARKAIETRARVVAAKMAKVPPFKLRLLGGDWIDVQRKPRHQGAFDVVTVSTGAMFVLGSPRLNGLLRPRAACLLETGKFLVEIRKDNRLNYAKGLVTVATRLGWELGISVDQVDGQLMPMLRFSYDAETAEALAEAVKAREEAAKGGLAQSDDDAQAAAVPQLTHVTDGHDEPVDVSDADAAPVDASSISSLQIVDSPAAEADAASAPLPAAAKPAAEIAVRPGSAAQMDAKVGGKVCVITGQPAKYRDPISGLPYADLAAFRELRKLHPDPKAEEKAREVAAAKEAAERTAAMAAEKKAAAEGGGESGSVKEGEDGGEGDEGELVVVRATQQPIVIGDKFARRVNKVA